MITSKMIFSILEETEESFKYYVKYNDKSDGVNSLLDAAEIVKSLSDNDEIEVIEVSTDKKVAYGPKNTTLSVLAKITPKD